jgi:osmoprotectant transport system substrate-binding protein
VSKVLAIVLALVIGGACGGDGADSESPMPSDGLRIAGFDFAESELLAELYAQVLEAGGTTVVRLGRIGPREVVAPALELDLIDLVPEYTGTASGHFGGATADLEGLADALTPRGLVALEPALAQDVNAFVVTAATAEANDLVRLSDLSEIAPTARFGGPVECPERPLCLLGLAETYGLTFAEFVPQRSLAVTAEALARGEIDVALMFSTSAEIIERNLVILEDDRGLQPPENVVPVIRRSALDRWGLAETDPFRDLSRALTTRHLRQMNQRVQDGEPVDSVARSWLTVMGLLAE